METKMNTNSTESNKMPPLTAVSGAAEHPETGGQARRCLGAGWRAKRHLLEMVVAMIAGMAALAVACGVLSGVSNLFEGLYLPLWYLGPFNKLPALAFAGAGGAGRPLAYLALAALLVCATLAARRRG